MSFGLLLFNFILLNGAIAANTEDPHKHHHPKMQTVPLKTKLNGESLYNLKGNWKGIDGKKIPLVSLKGQSVFLTMAYTRCKATCPLTIHKLKEIDQAALQAGGKDYKIVMASFDPISDTPDRLASFLKERKLDSTRWMFLSPERDSDVRELSAVLGIVYSIDKDREYSHSNVISLLDREGAIVTQINGLTASHEDAVKRLMKEKNGK